MNSFEPHYREAEHRRLGVVEIERLARSELIKDPNAALEPQAGEEAQIRRLRMMFLIFGGMFLLASVVFFFAWNWAWLSAAARFASLQIGIVASIAGSWFVGFRKMEGQALLLAASALTGVLCATYGQIYQRGADAYEIFVWWAGLTFVWTVAAKSAALWTLWLAVAQTALITYWYQVVLPAGGSQIPTLYLILGLSSAGFLVLREWIAGREGGDWLKAEWTRAILVGAALYWLSSHPLMLVFDYGSWRDGPAKTINWVGTTCWGLALPAALWFFAARRPSITALWLGLISFCVVSTAYFAKRVFDDWDWEFWHAAAATGLAAAALFGMATFGLIIVRTRLIKFDRLPDDGEGITLTKLQSTGVIDPESRNRAINLLSWWPGSGPLCWQARLLCGIGMWIAGVFLAIGVYEWNWFDEMERWDKTWLLAGAILVSVLVGRFRPGWPILDQFWLSISVGSHVLLSVIWIEPSIWNESPWNYDDALHAAIACALVVYPISRHAIQRYFSIALVWQLLIMQALKHIWTDSPIEWWYAALLCPALGWILLLWTKRPFWRPALFACVTGSLSAMFFGMLERDVPWWILAMSGLLIGLGVGVHLILNRLPGTAPWRRRLAAILGLSGFAVGPGIPALLGMSALGVRRHDRFFLGLAAVFAPAFIFAFYNYFGLTLLTKSIILAICGAGAIAVSFLLRTAESKS